MRYIIPLIALFVTAFTPVRAAVTPKDNLLLSLSRTNDPEEQVRIYRNLADLTFQTPESCGYLIKLVEKAQVTAQTRQMMEALTDLSINYMMLEKLDSAHYFTDRAEELVPKKQRDQWCCYLEMRLFIADLLSKDAEKIIDEYIASIKDRDIAKESIYAQLKAEYLLGKILHDKDQNNEAISHLIYALKLSKQLPFRNSCPYQLLIMRQMSRIYNKQRQQGKAIAITKNAIEIKEHYYNLYDKNERPFFPIDDFYITNYASLMICIDTLPDSEARFYMGRMVEMSSRSNNPYHKYSCFLTLSNYYSFNKDRHKALEYNDSLRRYALRIAPYNLPGIYRVNSELYEELGQHEDALINLKTSYRLKDSLRQHDMQTQYDKLRVEYDVNRLNFENSQLEIRNKHILLVFMSVVLLFALILCFYLYSHLKREREVKERMQELKTRAEESEKLKTAFINSICHEIRTPLNGIVGFSHLLIDPSIDPEEKETFPAEIQSNTNQLIALIDSMLEVSNLDVSDEQLPCEEVDLAALCRMVFKHFTSSPDAGNITGIIDIPESKILVQTNERYLSMVLENLLANAYKFTRQGSITLRCIRETDGVTLSITDTGCGISKENHEKVFDRFFKLDTHTQGSGLGLYLCKIIVRRLPGKIFIDPEYDNGTRIIVFLPLHSTKS